MKNTRIILDSILGDLANAEKTIIRKKRNFLKEFERIFTKGWVLLVGLILGMIAFWMSIDNNNFLFFIGYLGLWVIAIIIYIFTIDIIFKKVIPDVSSKIQSIIQKHKILFTTFQISECLDDILKKTQLVSELIGEDLIFIKEQDLRILTKIINMEILFCSSILFNLRSNLYTRLTEQQQSLESAKSEVEKHISGTTELEQVSELQKARLDRQIEQFEELQRVLVKM